MNIRIALRKAGLVVNDTALFEELKPQLTTIIDCLEQRGDYDLFLLDGLEDEVDLVKQWDDERYALLLATFPNGVEWLTKTIEDIKKQLKDEYPLADVVAAVTYLESVGFWFYKSAGDYLEHRRSLCLLAHLMKTIDTATPESDKSYLQTYNELYLPSSMDDKGMLKVLLNKIHCL